MVSSSDIKAAIQNLLSNDDPGLRYHSAWWLGKMKIKEASPALCQCLSEDTEQTSLGGYPLRRQAARSLGMIKEKEAVDPLLDALNSHDPRLQEASILALKAIGDRKATEGLINFLQKDLPQKPHEALIETLAALEAWSIRDLIEPYLNDGSERIKGAAAVYLFCLTRDESFLEPLLVNLRHHNPFIRQSSAFDLAQCKYPRLHVSISEAELPNNVKLAALKQILETYELEVTKQSDGCLDLTVKNLLEAIDLLMPNAVEGNLPTTSFLTNDAHSSSNLRENLEQLLSCLRNSNSSEQLRAIERLIILGRNDITIIIQALDECVDEDIRAGLVQVIYELADPQTIKSLQDVIGLDIANHCQGKLRRVSILALGRIYTKTQFEEDKHSIFTTLNWALNEPDDWGLRYSSVMAWENLMIESKASKKPFDDLDFQQELPVVRLRIKQAIAKIYP